MRILSPDERPAVGDRGLCLWGQRQSHARLVLCAAVSPLRPSWGRECVGLLCWYGVPSCGRESPRSSRALPCPDQATQEAPRWKEKSRAPPVTLTGVTAGNPANLWSLGKQSASSQRACALRSAAVHAPVDKSRGFPSPGHPGFGVSSCSVPAVDRTARL
jgi:hypothetical protein